MRVHMIGAVLRVVFDHEDCGVLPDGALADRFHQLAYCVVVVGYLSQRALYIGTVSLRVIVHETYGHKGRDGIIGEHQIELALPLGVAAWFVVVSVDRGWIVVGEDTRHAEAVEETVVANERLAARTASQM